MSDTVLAALITGILGLLSAVLAAMISRERERRRQKEDAVKQESAVLKAASAVGGSAPAYEVDCLTAIHQFEVSGAGSISKTWSSVRATQEVTNLTIPYESWAVCPGAKLGQPSIEEKDTEYTVSLRDIMRNDGRVTAQLVVNGYMTPGGSAVSFNVQQPFEKAYCMTQEEVEEAYGDSDWKTEYAAVFVNAPTATVELEVRLPTSWREMKRPQVVVFLRGGESVVGSETGRLKGALVYHDGIAKLEVKNPNPGLVYAIAWMPPSVKRLSGDHSTKE